MLYEIPIEEIVKEVGECVGVAGDRIHSLGRDRVDAYGRDLVTFLARKLAGYLVKDVAKYFCQEPMTISQGIKKVEDLLRRDKDLAKRVGLMERYLIGKGKKKFIPRILFV